MGDEFYSKKNLRSVDFARPSLLLHPNIPKPLHGLAPREILGKDWWDATRRECYKQAHYHCQACGVSKEQARYHQWLEAHEVYEINYPLGRAVYTETVALCHSCHNFIHDGRMKIMVRRGEMSAAKQKHILTRGAQLLVMAGLRRSPYIGACAKWHKWRLVLDGKEYEPIHKTFEDWAKHYGHIQEEEEEEGFTGADLYEDWVPFEMEEH